MKTQISPQERELLRKRYAVPVKPIKGWKVMYCGCTAYENVDIKLCWHFIKLHSLKVKPIAIR